MSRVLEKEGFCAGVFDEAGKMEKVRIRVEFENSEILSKPQRSEGLNRSWILFKPQLHKSISDLISYILRIFNLHHSCPNGILLSMEGFVLPPFESTCILKDKDIICIKKKGADLLGGVNSVEEIDTEENQQPIDTGFPLLANEEFEKENGGYQSEEEEDEEEHDEEKIHVEKSPVSKKRKASKNLKSSKKKKHRSRDSDAVENDIKSTIDVESIPEIDEPTSNKKRKKRCRSEVSDAAENDLKNTVDVENAPEISKRNNKDFNPTSNKKRNDQHGPNGEELKDVSQVLEVTTKVPSRSARRKKAKRQWLREIAKAEKEVADSHPKEPEKSTAAKKELVSCAKGLLHWKQSPEKVIDKEITGHSQPSQNNDAKDELVPVVIRPGHIRFELLEDDEEAIQQNQVSVENYSWNGITSKKKGQKWGQENLSSLRVNDHKSSSKEYSETLTVEEEEKEENESVDFDKLPPLPSFPKEGDIIAYRLLELSSSWTPELSSFRVGRVSSYDPESTRVLLIPVSEYPINLEKLDEDSSDEMMKPENSLYNEDGSLEIEFSSLVDVRIVKQSNLSTAKTAVNDSVNEVALGSKETVSNSTTTKKDKEIEAQKPPENGEVKKSVWDEISEALNAKKAQLSEENEGTKRRSPWSYRALRGGALGPTMAILRSSKNSILE